MVKFEKMSNAAVAMDFSFSLKNRNFKFSNNQHVYVTVQLSSQNSGLNWIYSCWDTNRGFLLLFVFFPVYSSFLRRLIVLQGSRKWSSMWIENYIVHNNEEASKIIWLQYSWEFLLRRSRNSWFQVLVMGYEESIKCC